MNISISQTDNFSKLGFKCKVNDATQSYAFEMQTIDNPNYNGFTPLKTLFDLKFELIQFTDVILQLSVYNEFLELTKINNNLSMSIDSRMINKCAYVYENIGLVESDFNFKYIMKYFKHVCNLSEYDTLQMKLYENGLVSILLSDNVNKYIIPIRMRITNVLNITGNAEQNKT